MKLILASLLLFNFAYGEKLSKEKLKQMKEEQRWSFELDEEPKQFPLGLKKIPQFGKKKKIDKRFLLADVVLPGKFHQKDKWNLTPILNQGNCGSCVIFSVSANFMDSLSIRGVSTPRLSQQQLMNCGKGYQCDGYWFTGAADDLIALTGLVSNEAYPYTGRSGSCKQVNSPKFGPIAGKSLISNVHKSIMNAIVSGYPVSTTVGADNPFMAYKSGVYNACTNQGTNHETVIQGWDCEDQVDAQGNCILDADGYVAAGKGYWYMRNSWDTSWGEQGWMRIKMSKPSNKKALCNNLTEEVGILETGLPVPSPKPPEPTPDPKPPVPPGPAPAQLPVWVWIVFGVGALVIVLLVKVRVSAKLK